jgi:hypothetical protein
MARGSKEQLVPADAAFPGPADNALGHGQAALGSCRGCRSSSSVRQTIIPPYFRTSGNTAAMLAFRCR